jgi:ubiquinone/menaquinone biosynthesis C-methylase UbiE
MHVPDLDKALSELARVLRPGGTLVISESNVHSPDVAIRERVLRGIKRMIGRERSTVNRLPQGLEVWTDHASGGLLARKADPRYLKDCLATLGLTQTARIAGELTQVYTNMPLRALKRAIYAINLWYFTRIGSPGIALGNIFFFTKG